MNIGRYSARLLAIFSAALLLAASAQAELEIRNPRTPQSETTRATFHILGRADVGSSVTVNGDPATIFGTGIFVRDNVPLNPGANTINISAVTPAGDARETSVQITRVGPKPDAKPTTTGPLFVQADSVQPSHELILSPGDPLEVSFRGTPGARASASLRSGLRVRLYEETDPATGEKTGLYRGTVVVTEPAVASPVTVRLSRAGDRPRTARAKGMVEVWDPAVVRQGTVKWDFAQLSLGIHEVRLGGPYLTELSSGTILRLTGRLGGNYRVRLTPSLDAWVDAGDLEMTTPSMSIPHSAFLTASAMGDEKNDFIQVPFPQRIPFSITPVTSPGNNAVLNIDFYGAHNAATWLSHRPSAKVIREISTEQIGTDHLRLRAELNTPVLWGYQCELTTTSLRITVRRPPQISGNADRPFEGLTIALEAGHGGPRDRGAGGVSGSNEKDINLSTTKALADILSAGGAKIVMTREADVAMSLGEKTRRAIDANADLFISIHANSAGSDRGYLAVSGTSTYYKYGFSRDLSEAIHARLLDALKIGDFGNVGNFNYSPLRKITWMPGMLVEQAFMSNPQDEALMLDPEFRQKLAQAVADGTADFLKQTREALAK